MKYRIPEFFRQLQQHDCIEASHVVSTDDGFFMVYKSLADILSEKNITDFLDSEGERLACCSFFDDWYLYAVQEDDDCSYSLLKLREQEFDAQDGSPADGDTPGVTISFIGFDCTCLENCLMHDTDENRSLLSVEINRVVSYLGQRHDATLKRYFVKPASCAPYLVADLYTKHIASFAQNGRLSVPERYKEIVQASISYKDSAKIARLPKFIRLLNEQAGRVVCDQKEIFLQDPNNLNEYEKMAILATHTGNTSVFSFAAEVEYHAKYLFPIARTKIPFYGKSIYESAIRADMTIDDNEFEGPAPFYQENSKIVKRQIALHSRK